MEQYIQLDFDNFGKVSSRLWSGSLTLLSTFQKIEQQYFRLFEVKPDPSRLNTIYTTIGVDYDEKVLPSIVNEVLKAVVAMFNA